MMKKNSFFAAAAAAAAFCAVLLTCRTPLKAFAAGSVEDVYAAMRDIGMSEAMVQQAKNQYQTTPHDDQGMEINGHYATYDIWAEYVYIYEEQIWEVIDEQFLNVTETSASDAPTATVTTTTTTAAAVSGETTAETSVTTRSAEERKEFINMTLDEKKAYVNSLPEDERQAFLRSLSASERNSIIKQLDTDSQAEIAQGFVDLSRQLGMNITVDSIGSGGIDYSVRDSDGTIIDVSSIGTQIDDTGWNTTLPLLLSCGAILAAIAGLIFNAARSKKTEEDAANV